MKLAMAPYSMNLRHQIGLFHSRPKESMTDASRRIPQRHVMPLARLDPP